MSACREGLHQRRWVNMLAVYVGIGFVATELSLFLICRPLSNYWAVPTPNCTLFLYITVRDGLY